MKYKKLNTWTTENKDQKYHYLIEELASDTDTSCYAWSVFGNGIHLRSGIELTKTLADSMCEQVSKYYLDGSLDKWWPPVPKKDK